MNTDTKELGIEIKISEKEKDFLKTTLNGSNGQGSGILKKIDSPKLFLTWSELIYLFGFTGEKPNGDETDPRNTLLERILKAIPTEKSDREKPEE